MSVSNNICRVFGNQHIWGRNVVNDLDNSMIAQNFSSDMAVNLDIVPELFCLNVALYYWFT